MKQFEEKGAQVLGLSSDSIPSLRAWATTLGGVNYPLLGDFHPQGKVLANYGLLNEETGTARRAAIVIDKEGIVRWSSTYEPGLLPSPDEVLGVLNTLG